MSGSAYGTALSSLETLLRTIAEVREKFAAGGAFGALRLLVRRNQRRNLLQLLAAAGDELEHDPDVLAQAIASGAAGADAAAWAANADAATKLALRGSAFVRTRQQAALQHIATLRDLLQRAAQGEVELQAIREAVEGLLDLFLPPGEGDLADKLATAAAAVTEGAELAQDAVAAAAEGRSAPVALRAVADRALAAASGALDAVEAKAVPAPAAVTPVVLPPPPPTQGTRYVVSPSPLLPLPTVTVPALSPAAGTAVSGERALVDSFLERRCRALTGCEVPPLRSDMLLAALARQSGAAQCGALHVTCTDEAEAASRDRFARGGVALLLPALAGGRGAVMQVCNRGGCWEDGLLAVAAAHYAPVSSPLTIVARVQAHCGVLEENGTRAYGKCMRYGSVSSACGALADGTERGVTIAGQLDPARLAGVRSAEARWRPLLSAVLQARTQLERLTAEARALDRPAWYVLFASVNLNGLTAAAEVPLVIRVLDRTGTQERCWELALPPDPAHMQVADTPAGVRLTPR